MYEGKISTLLHHADRRIHEENSESIEAWGRAIRALKAGDHYLSQLWDILPDGEEAPTPWLRSAGVRAIIAIAATMAVLVWIALRHGK